MSLLKAVAPNKKNHSNDSTALCTCLIIPSLAMGLLTLGSNDIFEMSDGHSGRQWLEDGNCHVAEGRTTAIAAIVATFRILKTVV